ncbi:hypothetical protein [Emcibacter sp. SYSU 3D8]|uniref:hypothetical protein n=1 Tax=Emcibacter sp. SYSU 3D8 TaxID=3133969 RepID=UPI0031FE924A
MPEQPVEPIREAVGVFTTFESLQSAIDELLTSGFDRAELSLLAGEHAVEEKLGHTYRRVAQLEDDETVPRAFYVNPESVGAAEGALVSALLYVGAVAGAGAIVATGGTLAAVIAGAALMGGAGGAIGTVLAVVVGEHHAQYLQEQLDHGGLLLWVRTWDADREKRAVGILEKHSGKDVHVHAIQ